MTKSFQSFLRSCGKTLQDGLIKLLLAAKVIADQRPIHPGSGGDLFHGGAVKTLDGEQIGRRSQQSLGR